jgi:uncharacterized protein YqgV (UPF0045/DUF77 family)
MSTNQFRRYLDLLNEADPVLPNTTQPSSEPRCATCGTPQSQHQALKHSFVAGGAANRPAPPGGVGRIKKLQAELKAAGADLGTTGANRDGIDGDIGPLTTTAMAKYPNIAAKYPELKGAAVAQTATPAVDTKKLDAALTAIESILAKYKVKLSEDCESSTTDKMKQWRSLMELTQADLDAAEANRVTRQAAAQSAIDARFAADAQAKNFGQYATAPAKTMPYSQAAQQAQAKYDYLTAKAAGAAEKGTASAAKGAAGALGKGIAKLSPGVGMALAVPDVYDRVKAGDYTGATISGLAGLASFVPLGGTLASLGLTGLNYILDRNKTPTTAISAEDAKTIIDNVEIMQNWAKDPANQNALTPELKTRIANNIKGVASLGVPTQAATPAAQPSTTAQPATTPTDNTPAARAQAALPTVDATVANLDKLLKKNNFESREPRTLSEQLARDRDIVDEGLASAAVQHVIKPVAKWGVKTFVKPIATVGGWGGIGYGGYETWKTMTAPKTMSAADKAEFDRILADYKKVVPDQATFDALPKPMQEKLIAVADRIVKMQQQQPPGN